MAKKRAFMVMPFGDPIAGNAYECCVRPVCEELALEIRRADELFTTNPIYDDIVQEINQATVIIVDVSGKNPNVFYELGIAHTLKQSRTIILTHDGASHAPFDIAHFRILAYEDSIKGTQALMGQLRKTIELLLQDLFALHLDEFEITYRSFIACDHSSVLHAIVGLSKLPSPLLAHRQQFRIVGEIGSNSVVESGAINACHTLQPAIDMHYAEIVGPHIQLTELGKAFAQFLVSNGVRCHVLNEHKFSPDYVPFKEGRDRVQGKESLTKDSSQGA